MKKRRFLSFLAVLYPNKCAGCKRIIPKDKVWCDDCLEALVYPKYTKHCRVCFQQKEFCTCRKHPKFYRSAVSAFEYKDSAKQAIARMKKYKNEMIFDFFAQEMANTINKRFKNVEFDAVLPVPMHIKKLRKRGFNQSEMLARNVSEKLGVPYENILLFQNKRTKSQHTLKYKQRLVNVKDAYKVANVPNDYKTVLLVDDVLTSGATINECAKQLRINGVQNVYCVTVAKR